MRERSEGDEPWSTASPEHCKDLACKRVSGLPVKFFGSKRKPDNPFCALLIGSLLNHAQ